jgi:hypothetical protein
VRSTKLPSWIENLLGFDPRPVPPHVFQLERHHLRYGQFVRAGNGLRLRHLSVVELPADAFHSGPLGGPLRDPAGFQNLVGELIKDASEGRGRSGVREASLVIPDAWLRVSFTEIDDLPKAREDRDEVLRWKLKRMVPFRVEELRIGATEVAPLPDQQEPHRLLLGFAVEQLLAQLEGAFAARNIRLGQITNASLALAVALAGNTASDPVSSGFTALVSVEEEGYTLAFLRGREPVLHRFKAFTAALPAASQGNLMGRDLKLTRNFLDEHFPGTPLERVLLVAPPALEPEWLERLEEGLSCPAAPLDGRHLPPLHAEGSTAPWRELAPMLGAARQEVA